MRKLVWLDFETTGLDSQSDRILEVSVALADFNDPYNYEHVYHAVLNLPSDLRGKLDPFIVDMHTKNGLLDECEKSTTTLRDVETALLQLIPEIADKEERFILAGSTIHFDQQFLNKNMPTLAKRLTHRVWDVSGLKLNCQSKGMLPFPKAEAHRTTADIEESIAHARACEAWLADYYRDKDRANFLAMYLGKVDGEALHDFG